jgi:hypothetical protein
MDIEKFFLAACALVIFVAVVLFGVPFYGVYQSYMSEKIELTKSEWVCTNSKTDTYLQPIIIGKTTLLQPNTSTVCTTYTRSK